MHWVCMVSSTTPNSLNSGQSTPSPRNSRDNTPWSLVCHRWSCFKKPAFGWMKGLASSFESSWKSEIGVPIATQNLVRFQEPNIGGLIDHPNVNPSSLARKANSVARSPSSLDHRRPPSSLHTPWHMPRMFLEPYEYNAGWNFQNWVDFFQQNWYHKISTSWLKSGYLPKAQPFFATPALVECDTTQQQWWRWPIWIDPARSSPWPVLTSFFMAQNMIKTW